MTALAADKQMARKEIGLLSGPCAVDILYMGALLKHNAAGKLAPCASESGAVFAGVGYEQKDNSGDEDLVVRYWTTGVFPMTISGAGQGDVGSDVYATDDDLVTTTWADGLQKVGRIVGFISSTSVWVQIAGAAGSDSIVTTDEIADSAVTLAKLDAGITPSHVVKYAGEHTTVGGAAAEAITVAGVLATDLVVCTLHTVGASPQTILTSVASVDTITATFSADPSNDHVLTYVVYRAAA